MNLKFFSVCIALLLLSCSSPQEDSKKKVFYYNEHGGITTLDPLFSSNRPVTWICSQLYNGLVGLDEMMQIQPDIAYRWEISEDGRLYTFYLRTDVYFHKDSIFKNEDERRVKASDFVYSFNRILDSTSASPGKWIFNSINRDKGQGGFEALNDTTLTIYLNQSFPPFLGILTMPYCSVIPKKAVRTYGKDFRSHPIGTGPFKLFIWKEGVKMILHKNEDYFEKDSLGVQLPYLDAVSISFLKDKEAAFLSFLRGDLDFINGIEGAYKDEILTKNGALKPEYQENFQLLRAPYLNTEYLGILMKNLDPKHPLHDKRVRQAINYAINKQEIITYLKNNIGTPAEQGIIPKGMPGFPSTLKGYSYQPEKAKALLKEAGYGTQKIPLTLSLTSEYLDIYQAVQQNLNAVGFEVSIVTNPPAVHRDNMSQGKLAFFRASWIADYGDAENFLSLLYGPNASPNGPNYTQTNIASFNQLYQQASTVIDDSERYQVYRAMDSLVLEEATTVPILYDQIVRVSTKKIKNFHTNALNNLFLKTVVKE